MVCDPITALGAVSASCQIFVQAYNLGRKLRQLYEDTQHVDQTVVQLNNEVTSLGDTLCRIEEHLKPVITATKPGSPLELAYDPNGNLWTCVLTEVEDCNETLKELDELVDTVRKEGSNFVSQARRQMRLNDRRDALSSLRQRVGTHNTSLQTALQLVNLKVAHLAPGYANEELRPRLENLGLQIQMLQNTLEQTRQRGATTETGTALVDCARDVMQSGTSLYEASVAGGSVCGGGGADNNLRTAQWVTNMEALHEDQSTSRSDDDTRASSVWSDENGHTVQSSKTSHLAVEEMAPADPADSDDPSDDEDELAMVKVALEEGNTAYEEQAWEEADGLLQETLSGLSKLPVRSRRFCDTFQLQYRLAVCAFHLDNLTVAEEALSSLLRQMPASDEQGVILCDAKFLLVRIYMRTGRLVEAATQCDAAGKGRRRLQGKDHHSYLETLALLSIIYQRLPNPPKARIYRSMIPQSQRTATIAATEELIKNDTIVASAPKASPPRMARLDSVDSGFASMSSIQSNMAASVTTITLVDTPEQISPSTEVPPSAGAQSGSNGHMPNGLGTEQSPARQSTVQQYYRLHDNHSVSTLGDAHTGVQPASSTSQSNTPKPQQLSAQHRNDTIDRPNPFRAVMESANRAPQNTSPQMIESRSHLNEVPRPAVQGILNSALFPAFGKESSPGLRGPSRQSTMQSNSDTVKASSDDASLVEKMRYETAPKLVGALGGHLESTPSRTLSREETPLPAREPITPEERRHMLTHFIGLEPKTQLEKRICAGDVRGAINLFHHEQASYLTPESPCSKQPTALHFAALFGDVEIGRALVRLDCGTKTEITVESCHHQPGCLVGTQTWNLDAFSIAIGARQAPFLKMLIESGFRSPETCNVSDISLCISARWLSATNCRHSREVTSILRCLLDNGLPTGKLTSNFLASAMSIRANDYFEHEAIIRSLLEAGTKVLPDKSRQAKGTPGYDTMHLPLHQAIKLERHDLVPVLLEQHREAQLSIVDPIGTTALGTAVSSALSRKRKYGISSWQLESLDTVKALLKAGADARAQCTIPFVNKRGGPENLVTSPLELVRTHHKPRKDLTFLLESYCP